MKNNPSVFDVSQYDETELVASLQHHQGFVYLDSSDSASKWSAYSFIGFLPKQTTKSTQWEDCDRLFEQSKSLQTSDEVPFYGGLIGYISYEAAQLNPIYKTVPFKSSPLPLLYFGLYTKVVVIEKNSGKKQFINHDDSSPLDHFLVAYDKALSSHFSSENLAISIDSYSENIQKILDYIHNGDIYQSNFSYPLRHDFSGSLWPFYQQLRTISPAPFSAFLNLPFTQIACSSPERFIKIFNGNIQTQPIKGTLPKQLERHQTATAFQSSDKFRSELDMITDLQRNDLGQVCEFGTVKVIERQAIEHYSTVSHSSSLIEGTLKPYSSPFQLLKIIFPSGSITGAPKRRALDILNQLEPFPRSIYTGCIGYVSPNGNCDFNIAIRTAYTIKNQCYFHTGGGIIADSNAKDEWDETLVKSLGFRKALEPFL